MKLYRRWLIGDNALVFKLRISRHPKLLINWEAR